MIKIFIASKNPVKLDAVDEGLSVFLKQEVTVLGGSVESGVSDQPMSDIETLVGAESRVKNAHDLFSGFDYYVGIEGGVEESESGLMAFAWVVISDGTKIGKARTATFTLPPRVAELIHQGYELGDADDIVFEKMNSKQQNGAVGLLTNDVITRKILYQSAVQLAFIPFLNPELYPG
ncbi:MAG: inosine/xanthosine triphosphatase [Prolixibacteraceae bacterium]|nr:inosine/xanthosine triphosphatase [Prolixibacteraceae bacterium]